CPRGDVVELRRGRVRGEDSEGRAEDPCGDGEPADTLDAARDRPDARADRGEARKRRPPRRTRGDRGQGQQEGEAAQQDAEHPGLPGSQSAPDWTRLSSGCHQAVSAAGGEGFRRRGKTRRRACHTYMIRTSAPTKSRTS